MWNVPTYRKRLRYTQARVSYEYCYQAPCSNTNAMIEPLRDVITLWKPSKAHLFNILQAFKRLTSKELGNNMPVYGTIGLEDYIVKK